MGKELGRISGPLLSANLVRNHVDLAFEDDLIYLKVVDLNSANHRVGINTASPSKLLTVNGDTKIGGSNPGAGYLLVNNTLDSSNFKINTNTIRQLTGSLYIQPDQLSDPTIIAGGLGTLNLRIRQGRLIESITTNSDINLDATSNLVKFYTDTLHINETLHATGNITWDGDITFGSDDNDSVTFSSDVNSDVIPNINDEYTLGTATKQWDKLHVEEVVADVITTPSMTVGSIDMMLTQGNTYYVSVNGADTNTGRHPQSTYRTVKYALSQATAGDEVLIFPGEYEEIFPLTIRAGVSVKGTSIRSTIIYPTAETETQDAFLLNGDTTVEFLTVKNFYYDSVANTGHAFRFANNFKTVFRSPYIQNVTVINQEPPVGSGYVSGGKGILADGSVVHPDSKEASILCFAVTLIVPNADGITMTNGVRVEWLNSFTYFAYRGIYLTTGSLGFANLGTKFGGEMRSINSANVYGTYGAVADGLHTLAYLIGHNFGYIGAGTNSMNDRGLVIQANEVVAINDGEIYFDSMDHKGDYRVGDIFYVNQETGQVSFDAQSINLSASGNIVLEGPNGTTILDATGVQTGNIRVHDNNIDSVAGPVNFHAASGFTYLNTNVYVTGFINISGDVLVNGTVYLGNDPLDLINIAPNLTQNIIPRFNNTFNLGQDGATPKIWRKIFVSALDIDGATSINNNTITVNSTNTDLQFLAAGTGKVYVPSNNVEITNSLTVGGTTVTINGTSTLQNTEIVGTTTLVGNYNQTGASNAYITGLFANNNISITGALSYLQVPDIKIVNNVIQATATNSDINFVGNAGGAVVIDSKLKFLNNAISNNWTGAINDTQKSILLSPNGFGDVVINSTNALVIPYASNTNQTLSAVGQIRHNSSSQLYEGWSPNGNVSFTDIYDSDRNTYITAELTPGANDNTIRFGINGTVKSTINSTRLFDNLVHFDNVVIAGNTISTLNTANDLTFAPNGLGSTVINSIPFKDNTVTNVTNNVFILASTGQGYIKFSGKGAVVFPAGPTEDRRSTPELGEIRYNTSEDYQYSEIWNGTVWQPVTGNEDVVTETDVTETNSIWSLILG